MSIFKNKSKFAVLVPLFVALVLRLYKLTESSIWHDEGYTMWLVKYNFSEIIARTARDVHPPGYYLLIKPWVEIFGTSELSVRMASLIFSIGIVYLVYLIIRSVWSEKAAFWAAMFVALSPHMVRFGQEARMYGVVAFFTTLATYFLVKMIKTKKSYYLLLYVPALLLGFYNQYYAFFVLISHWIILSIYSEGFWEFKWNKTIKNKLSLLSWRWILANVVLFLGYAAWFPVAYRQVTRVSGNYWIMPEWITIRTVPNNVFHFLTYTHLDAIYIWNKFAGPLIYWSLVAVLIAGPLIILWKTIVKDNKKFKVLLSLYIFGYLPMILVYTISEIASPIYQDRYFPFSAVAILAILGVAVSEIKSKYLRWTAIFVLTTTMIFGNYVLHHEVKHQMKQLAEEVIAMNVNEKPIVSGELYTFLDGAYYFGYDNLKLLIGPVDGYGETSLFYDQSDYYVFNKEKIKDTNSFWLIGKTGKDYWDDDQLKAFRIVDTITKSNLRATYYEK